MSNSTITSGFKVQFNDARYLSFELSSSVVAPPTITTPSLTTTVQPGDTSSLHCKATGKPRPKISWYHGGHQLETNNWLSVLANGTLIVYNAEKGRDEGVYTCKAENTQGTDEVQSSIKI